MRNELRPFEATGYFGALHSYSQNGALRKFS
jgi:hypothetical protein